MQSGERSQKQSVNCLQGSVGWPSSSLHRHPQPRAGLRQAQQSSACNAHAGQLTGWDKMQSMSVPLPCLGWGALPEPTGLVSAIGALVSPSPQTHKPPGKHHGPRTGRPPKETHSHHSPWCGMAASPRAHSSPDQQETKHPAVLATLSCTPYQPSKHCVESSSPGPSDRPGEAPRLPFLSPHTQCSFSSPLANACAKP